MVRDIPMSANCWSVRERGVAGALQSTVWSTYSPEPKCSHLESLSSDWKGHSEWLVLVIVNNDGQLEKNWNHLWDKSP